MSKSSSSSNQELDPAQRFLNREISWLRFNDRVLQQAVDERTGLLDRLFFLGIYTSNLDEFMMKRVGGLKRQVATHTHSRSLDGQTAAQQLKAIREHVLRKLTEQAACFQSLRPMLQENDIHLLDWSGLTGAEKRFAVDYFQKQVFPVLTPLAVDPGHPFPFISNLSLSLGVTLTHPQKDEKLFARVKVPESLPAWIRLRTEDNPSRGPYRFLSLQELIRAHLEELFPQMKILNVMPFRVTRNADIERDEEDAEDLLEMMEQELRARRFANAIRLEHGPNPDPWMLRFLMEELGLGEQDVYELPELLDYTDLKPVVDLDLPALKAQRWTPVVPPALSDPDRDIFSVLRKGDVLLHHPYESFAASVERFIEEAAKDPQVLTIKMTLYRTAADSHFVKMLIRAAEAGKQVVCLLELKARFDEQRNIDWSHRLEEAGVHVVYGIVGLKTHSKTALVVRQEPEGIRAYTHIGTGNYHSITAKLYTDFGLLTADPTINDDVIQLFNHLTGRSGHQEYDKLLVAPTTMKQSFLEMIQREIDHLQAGRPAHIVAKMNSLEDAQI
ncbi:MAG: polyphosphate kinase 1, partial [Phycisphaeraceae bacterium]|nr:polyphosphate kinase 1 [Phycisphaeraceae bacterium]